VDGWKLLIPIPIPAVWYFPFPSKKGKGRTVVDCKIVLFSETTTVTHLKRRVIYSGITSHTKKNATHNDSPP